MDTTKGADVMSEVAAQLRKEAAQLRESVDRLTAGGPAPRTDLFYDGIRFAIDRLEHRAEMAELGYLQFEQVGESSPG